MRNYISRKVALQIGRVTTKEIYNRLTKTRQERYRRMRAASITARLLQQIDHRDIPSGQGIARVRRSSRDFRAEGDLLR